MKLRCITYVVFVLSCLFLSAAEPNILVTQEGESFKVFNLDVTFWDNIYYTLSEEDNVPLQKILKKGCPDNKLIRWNKIAPATYYELSSIENTSGEKCQIKQVYSPKIYYAIEDRFVDLKFNPTQDMWGYVGMKKRYYSYYPDFPKNEHLAKFILATDKEGSVINFRLISDKERTLAVAQPRTEKQVKQLDWIKIKKIEYERLSSSAQIKKYHQ